MKKPPFGGVPYGIVGDGKASRHLQAYFRLLKTPYLVWRRGPGPGPAAVLATCRKIFILIDDSALAKFIRDNPFLKGRTIFHFSGSLELPGTFGLHPFMPLGPATFKTTKEYRSIPFALTEDSPPLRRLVPEFRNPSFRIGAGEKALYHALCVLGGNLPFLLWRNALRGLSKAGVPEKHIFAYFRASLANFERDPGTGLTGPLQRKDGRTIRSNLRALKGDPFRDVYLAFARASKMR